MARHQIDCLQVTRFRNISQDKIDFSSKINCLFGGNGNGKTNILEAIYLLSYKKSFRKNTALPEWLGIGADTQELFIRGVFDQNVLGLRFNPSGSQYFLNSRPFKRRPSFSTVFINPFDSTRLFEDRSFRRKFFDQKLSLLYPSFKKTLAQYNKLLKQRNMLMMGLHSASCSPSSLSSLDQVMAKMIPSLEEAKERFARQINPLLKDTYHQLFSEKASLELSYHPSIGEKEPTVIERILRQSTGGGGRLLRGPHRDDFVLLFNGLDASVYASLGQQKMSFLSVLFAYIEGFRYDEGGFPVVLMDDVSGELDQERWDRLVSYLGTRDFQVIITTANEAFRSSLISVGGVRKFTISSGRVKQELS